MHNELCSILFFTSLFCSSVVFSIVWCMFSKILWNVFYYNNERLMLMFVYALCNMHVIRLCIVLLYCRVRAVELGKASKHISSGGGGPASGAVTKRR